MRLAERKEKGLLVLGILRLASGCRHFKANKTKHKTKNKNRKQIKLASHHIDFIPPLSNNPIINYMLILDAVSIPFTDTNGRTPHIKFSVYANTRTNFFHVFAWPWLMLVVMCKASQCRAVGQTKLQAVLLHVHIVMTSENEMSMYTPIL